MGAIEDAYQEMMNEGKIKKLDQHMPIPRALPNKAQIDKIELLLEKIIEHFNIK